MAGRKLADQLKLKFTGTIGVLLTAKEQDIILSLRKCFELIKQTDFRIAPAILDGLLEKYEA